VYVVNSNVTSQFNLYYESYNILVSFTDGLKKNGQRRYKYLGRGRYYFVKDHSDSTKMFSETAIIEMLHFNIDNILVMLGGSVFQQTVGIPMNSF
jgi:hypothetical protein